MSDPRPIVDLASVSVRYGAGDREVWALRDVSFEVRGKEMVTVRGPSGSGKSTLLNVITGIERPTSGSVVVDGHDLLRISGNEIARLRRRSVACVFQFFNLLGTVNAWDNVALPLRADRVRGKQLAERVDRALAAVGLERRSRHYPDELSGGEMQRVAIARALATDAAIILADEPTGNLDSARGREILDLLRTAVDRDGRAVVLVTHDPVAASYGDRTVLLNDGRRVTDDAGASASGD
jgi:putative ABC transport system ATP-binding protein